MESNRHGFGNGMSYDTIDHITPSSPDQFELGFGTPLHAPVAPMNHAIESLHSTMHEYFSKITQRIDALEMFITQIHTLIADRNVYGSEVVSAATASSPSISNAPHTPQPHHQQPADHTNSQHSQSQHSHAQAHAPNVPSPLASVASPLAPSIPAEFELVLDGVKPTFFTERHFPPFTVRLIDLKTGQVHREANDWCVLFHLYDGYGRLVDEKLADDKTRKQYLMDGQTEVNGLRFMQVSSKNGGYFQLEAELIQPSDLAPLVRRGRSDNITVMSCRLYTCRKGSISRLNEAESVAKLPGIGRQYAQRLHEQGIRTIGDLAALSLDERDRERRQQLLDMVRREKGTMTEAKLVEYVRTAKSIVNGTGVATFSGKRAYEDFASPADVFEQDTALFKKQKLFDVPLDMPVFGITGDNMDSYLNTNFVEDTHNTLGAYENSAFAAPGWEYRSLTSNDQQPRDSHASGITLQSAAPRVSQSPLLVAVASRSLDTCKTAVAAMEQKRIPLDHPNQSISPLMLAAMLGAHDIVSYLLALPSIAHAEANDSGLNALHFAILQRHPQCVTAIVKSRRISATSPTKQGLTPLMLACTLGEAHIVEILAKAVPAAHITDTHVGGLSAFDLAAQSGSLATINALHAAVPVTSHIAASNEVPSLMHFAALSGNAAMVQWLCDRGITAHSTFKGWTPLHISAARAFADCVGVLCGQKDVDVNALTPEGWTALSLCSMYSDHDNVTHSSSDISHCIEVLMSRGAIDNGSHIPASAVSVVCSNLDALMTMHTHKGLPEVMDLPSGPVTMVDLTKSVGNEAVIAMLVSPAQ